MATFLRLVNNYRLIKDSIWPFVILGLFVFSACHYTYKTEVDELNWLSYYFHYKNLDSTYFYAHRALSLSEEYSDGIAEALNNLAFVYISRMNYDKAKILLDSVDCVTNNQIELLIADIQLMRLCQRESKNKDFYDYQERASRALRRINEERSTLTAHQQCRMVYAESEFCIVSSTYYYYVGQLDASRDALYKIDSNGEILKDTAQYLNYMYQIGAGGVIANRTKEDIAQIEWDYLMRCYMLSLQSGDVYWEANALQGMSEHMFETESRNRLITDNLPAMKFINVDNMPDTLLAGYLAQKSLEIFERYGDVYQIAGSYRTLAQCYWAIGDYHSAIICLEDALEKDKSIEAAPDLVASIRERLSLTYSALNDKANSDYNRNIYLDMQKRTRQDRELEARAEQLDRSSAQLNLMIFAVVVMILIVALSIIFFDYLRRRKDKNKPLTDLLRPLQEWQTNSENTFRELVDHQQEVNEQLALNRISIEKNMKRNVENRAKIFLVNSVTPFIDRIINEIQQLIRRKEPADIKKERQEYMIELTDSIIEYNNVLTQWIQLQQGQLSLHIESFPVQALFDILQRSRMAFKLKKQNLVVEPTPLFVKADRILTLFMINTIADNARKYTPEGGTVLISAREVFAEDGSSSNSCVEISVKDTGVGMDEEQLAGIFEHKVSGGHGFGLMNCKGIIETYRKVSQIFSVCSISAESKKGEGSRFSFRLPKGIMRNFLVLLFVIQSSLVFSVPNIPSTILLGELSDSVYECNLRHDFSKAIAFADSALSIFNRQNEIGISHKLLLYDETSNEPAELLWFREEREVDYNTILFLRNEIAVAALACHEWQLYYYNNKVYTLLYKELTADRSLGEYVKTMQRSEVNKNIAIILLVFLLVLIIFAYYMLYYRHRLFYRFCLESIEQINEMLLSEKSDEERLRILDSQNLDINRFPAELKNIVERIKTALSRSVEESNNQQLSLELTEDECRRSEYEDQKYYVCNSVLDNCLSTLKHETMYYPSRIKQLISDLSPEAEETEFHTSILAINELANYYKELYCLLSAQAMKQVDSIKHECKPISLYGETVLGEEAMVRYLFDILHKQSGEKKLQVTANSSGSRYISFEIAMPNISYREFFAPSVQNIPFLICRQIARENSEFTNRRRCGIVAFKRQEGGTTFIVTLAKAAA